jgi:Arc/MetJ family transcription regulator
MSVYRGRMARMVRTNLVIDEVLIHRVMDAYDIKTKREAVDFALRRTVGEDDPWGGMLALEGTGWEGDLDTMREGRHPST